MKHLSSISRRVLAQATLLLALPGWNALHAIVNYEEGRREVLGVQLLQDADDPSTYFYIPKYPHLATKKDGTYELLCIKYLDPAGGASGGLFHALVEFTLPTEALAEVEAALRQDQPGARIAGPVQLMQTVEEGEAGMGAFEVISATLSDTAEGGFTRSIIASKAAPITPGSKAVIAALLDPKGATLLFESLAGPTSDVSVSISAYYQAKVKAYNATVSADMETVYNHYSRVANFQRDFTKRESRKVVDQLVQNGGLKVEVFDQTVGLGLKADELDAILQLVTDKLTELMFDAQSGWAKEPPRETAVEAKQIERRRPTGWFSRVFGGERNPKYVTDDQYVLKKREDIQRRSFNLTLNKATTIKVPVNTAGNLGGLFKDFGDDERYFRVVDLTDPDFELRKVHFQIDGAYLDAFKDTINFASVNFRKSYPGRSDVTDKLHFTYEDIQAGRTIQHVVFSRIGAKEASWTEFEYQVIWSLRDRPSVRVPEAESQWIKTRDAAVSLVPPFTRRRVEIDTDRSAFEERGVRAAFVEFATVLGGEPRIERRASLRADDAEATAQVAIYHDRDEPVGWRVSWYATDTSKRTRLEVLESDFLFLSPPTLVDPAAEEPEPEELATEDPSPVDPDPSDAEDGTP